MPTTELTPCREAVMIHPHRHNAFDPQYEQYLVLERADNDVSPDTVKNCCDVRVSPLFVRALRRAIVMRGKWHLLHMVCTDAAKTTSGLSLEPVIITRLIDR